jgi:hypothetical protein
MAGWFISGDRNWGGLGRSFRKGTIPLPAQGSRALTANDFAAKG